MTLGILGSMVWDRIDHPGSGTMEGWGGISYSLAAAAVALPPGWIIRPLVKLGVDLADSGRAFLDGIPGIVLEPGVATTSHPQNRVHLRYKDEHHRDECLTGGVPPWSWQELEPRIQGLDALYVNMISGLELGLDTARRLRERFQGPIYADIHSLLLAVTESGHREPRLLPEAREWLACFDVVQVNQDELALLAGGTAVPGGTEASEASEASDLRSASPPEGADQDLDDGRLASPGRFAGKVVTEPRRPGAFLVTRGGEGATWFARGSGPGAWRSDDGEPGSHTTGDMAIPDGPHRGDPTGCGDVWGVTCFIALLRGSSLPDAVRVANQTAALKLGHQGAEGLYTYLEERL